MHLPFTSKTTRGFSGWKLPKKEISMVKYGLNTRKESGIVHFNHSKYNTRFDSLLADQAKFKTKIRTIIGWQGGVLLDLTEIPKKMCFSIRHFL